MEALGVASGIAGLIGLAEIVAFKGSKYAIGVKNAGSDIKNLILEVQSLYGVLNRLKLLAKCLEEEQSAVGTTQSLASGLLLTDSDGSRNLEHFQTCRKNLDHLKKSLDDKDQNSKKTKLSWPFKASETKELIEKIARNKRDLSDALTADGLTALVASLSSQSDLIENVRSVKQEFQKTTLERAESEKGK
ncbi:hypothetical protein LOCC1_G007356 [Lachnellula occidentalis]|uniref:Fungal N-terminal domain-containing protein n=1 Tax=Lachnellula occidentalis TaxID=215460 RepID=A0A8H8U6I6_9HELO|nr:hypothetical protein LOCC1_G007356 [Lachnellula occidentalis]